MYPPFEQFFHTQLIYSLLALYSSIPRILENKTQKNAHPLTILYPMKTVLSLTPPMHSKLFITLTSTQLSVL